MTTTKQQLVSYTIAWNTALREVASSMDLITLLRNCHPAYRGNFALTLVNEKQISKEAGKEFIKIVG